MRRSRSLLLLALVPVALVLAGCAPGPAAADGELRIVASTGVYGDIAATVAGEHAAVTSLVTSTVQDPHSYELTARDRLALERADLVVFNGGGYDPYVATALDAIAGSPRVVEAVEIAGLEGDHDEDHAEEHAGHAHLEGVNEHLWYDLHVMAEVADGIADALAELDPANAEAFAANAEAFGAELEGLEGEVEALAARASGLGVVVTELVPGYLIAEAGLVDLTPEGFSAAIEEGTDVSPALLAETLSVVREAALVTNNPQTGGRETAAVLDAADEAGVPVVDFLELLPAGETYVSWMRGNIAALAAALP